MLSLVTGATGHVGNTLIRALTARGERPRALVLRGDDLSALAGLPVEIYYGNVLEPESLLRAMDGVDRVYHLAGMISIQSAGNARMRKINVIGTRNVIEACRANQVERLIYVSSIHAVEDLPKNQIITEPHVFDSKRVHGAYAKSKAEATKLVLSSGLNAVVVLPTGIIGPNEYKESHLGQMVRDFASRHLRAYIDGEYNFVDVRDVADGMIAAAERGHAGECYILSGERATVLQMFQILQDATGVHAPKVKLPVALAKLTAPLAECYYRILKKPPLFTPQSIATLRSNCNISNSKARRELGFSPRSVSESLHDAVLWLKTQNRVKIVV